MGHFCYDCCDLMLDAEVIKLCVLDIFTLLSNRGRFSARTSSAADSPTEQAVLVMFQQTLKVQQKRIRPEWLRYWDKWFPKSLISFVCHKNEVVYHGGETELNFVFRRWCRQLLFSLDTLLKKCKYVNLSFKADEAWCNYCLTELNSIHVRLSGLHKSNVMLLSLTNMWNETFITSQIWAVDL